MSLLSAVRGWFSRMFSRKDIETALQIEIAVSPEMRDAQMLWRSGILGAAPWNDSATPSLRLWSSICTEIAVPVVLEFESEVTGSAMADYLELQYQPVKDDLKITVEKALAGGEIIFKPAPFEGNIRTIISETDSYYPLKYDTQDRLTSVIFSATIQREQYFYTLLEKCTFENRMYRIEYTAWRSDNRQMLGVSIPLSDIPEWSDLPPLIEFYDVERPWFVVFKIPRKNNIDPHAPQGIAIFADAVDLIRDADEQHAETRWEFKGGELAIDAPTDLFREPGNIPDKDYPRGRTRPPTLPQGKDRLFRLNQAEPIAGQEMMKVFNPDFRDESLHNEMNRIKRQIEFICGMSYGRISDPREQQLTATEIEAAQQRFFSTVSDIQDALQDSLTELIDVMANISFRYGLAPQGTYDISFFWDDSIIVDAKEEAAAYDAELTRLMALEKIGVVSIEEIRAFVIENSDYFSKITEKMVTEAARTLPAIETEPAPIIVDNTAQAV